MPPDRVRSSSPGRRAPTLIVHGGAGADPNDEPDALRDGIRAAVAAGWRLLAAGGSSIAAVEAAVRVLEDAPRFNAGRGSVLTSAGTVETDASIMEGDELVTERRRRQLEASTADLKGTVGAVALDVHGTIAAATSTGGMSGKLPGRVGDTPLIGCGTYADSAVGGVSCTGSGEAIIRVVLARRALDALAESDDPDYAAHVAVDLLVEKGRGEGGLILVDARGRIGYAQSTSFMPVGWMAPTFPEPQVPF